MKKLPRHEVKRIAALLCSMFAMSFSAGAHAGGDGDLWVGFVAMVCVAQDPAYINSSMGRHIPPEFVRQKSELLRTEAAKCSAEGDSGGAGTPYKGIPRPLCETLMNADEATKIDASTLYAEYAPYIQGLDRLGKCGRPMQTPQAGSAVAPRQ